MANMTSQGDEWFPKVLYVFNELARKATSGDFLCRGEPECYERVSSSLYRKYSDIEAERFDIAVVQKEILEEARRFIRETDHDAILDQLQHFGYPTNLIDFTTDYSIALFFACDSQPEKDGRVILLNKTDRNDLREPKAPENRLIAQKSVFVQPREGFVEPHDTVVIPKQLKQPILDFLDKTHGVKASVLFNDIHGFIRYYSVHQSAYVEYYTGLTYAQRGDLGKAIKCYSSAIGLNPQSFGAHNNRGVAYADLGDYTRAIQDFSKAIELDPDNANAYDNRGITFQKQGIHDRAIQDFSKAIELMPSYSLAYFNRGLSKMVKEDWVGAALDLVDAQGHGYNVVSGFRNLFGNVGDFELDKGIQLPEGIKALLTAQQ